MIYQEDMLTYHSMLQ